MKSFKPILLIIFLILFLDQSLKIWVKLNMRIGDEIPFLGQWAFIHFIENNGMAFGWQLSGAAGKLILSITRLLAVVLFSTFLFRTIKRKGPPILRYGYTLVIAGAIGNILDTCFYGMLFGRSSLFSKASFLPSNGGYANFLEGKVVDLFYFPIIRIHQSNLPSFFPDTFFGPDNYFILLRPIFNIADISLVLGSILLLHYQYQQLKKIQE